MKKIIKLGLILTVLCLALLWTTSCDLLGGGEEEVSQQLVKVARGDLTIRVAGSGKIETSLEARLAFGSAGKVDKILVEEGDRVSKGEVLAKLDTSALELARTQSQVALTQAQLAEQTAGYNLKSTRDSEEALKLALLSTQISLDQAKYNLEQTQDLYTWSDIKTAKANVDSAERYLEDLLDRAGKFLPEGEDGSYPEILEYVFGEDYPKTPGYEIWQEEIVYAQSRLNAAEDRLDAMLYGSDTEDVAIKKKQVEAAEMSVAQAQKNLDELGEDIALQELQVDSAGQSVELAGQSLDEARRQLDEATIVAPFEGIVAQVLAKEGDNIPQLSLAPKTIIHLIDPGQMELLVEVDEIDIPLVEIGQEAVISVDALPDAEFQGIINAVYPVPKEEGGVVLYDVRLSLDAPENSGIKVGMSASAEVLIEKRSNVLMVPSRAIEKDNQGKTIVKVMSDEQVQERQVVVGLDDGFRIEIVSGLREGETVVIESRVRSTSGVNMF